MASNEVSNIVALIGAVDEKISKVRTRSLDVSFNELFDMKKSDELVIAPEYQRLFRWSEGKQSRFIESLILELPVPPIFVIEKEDGKYELIDGLQRISSYLHFRGELPDIDYICADELEEPEGEDGEGGFNSTTEDAPQFELVAESSPGAAAEAENVAKFLRLTECDIVTELNGHTYESLPSALKIKLKRNFVRMEVIRKESDPRLRYYMFKRLNTGGETLSNQEIRNCTIRLLDDGHKFSQFIIELSDTPDFKTCISYLSLEKKQTKVDQELVMRFFAYKNARDKYVHDISDFVTDYMEGVCNTGENVVPFNYDEERMAFEKTFALLKTCLGEDAFCPSNKKGSFIRRFSPLHYESFTLGVQPFVDEIDLSDSEQVSRLSEVLKKVKTDSTFIAMTTGGGRNYAKLLNGRVLFVENSIRGIM
ncbi:MAG: GmrSD restriction endonuclease domain-containing protein [Armatimonadota bacterium]